MSSLSGSGEQSNTRRSICTPTTACRRPGKACAGIWCSTTAGGHTHRWTGRHPIKHTSTRRHQSRWQHNRAGNPLTKRLETVQTNRTTSACSNRCVPVRADRGKLSSVRETPVRSGSASVLRRILAQLVFYAINAVGAYVALNLLLLLVRPFVLGWPVTATTAVTVPLMVIAMIHAVVPVAMRVRAALLARAQKS